jgi:hypothetical protein
MFQSNLHRKRIWSYGNRLYTGQFPQSLLYCQGRRYRDTYEQLEMGLERTHLLQRPNTYLSTTGRRRGCGGMVGLDIVGGGKSDMYLMPRL